MNTFAFKAICVSVKVAVAPVCVVTVNSSLFRPVVILTALATKAVVAICVVFVPAVAVGAVGVPVNVGEAKGAAPKLVKAAEAEVAPVPPFAIGTVPNEMALLEMLNGLDAEVTPVTGAAAQLGIPAAKVNIWPSDPFANKLVAPEAV